MKRFYIRYTPVRSGLTGFEYLAQYLDHYFPGIKYYGVISDGLIEYGYIEGTGDALSKAIQTCADKFSIKKFEENIFVGYCYPLYNPILNDETEPPTFEQFMESHNINITEDLLDLVKKAKKEEFKEIVKKEFYDWNDSIADVSKAASLLSLYSDVDYSPEQLIKKDELLGRIKQIYTLDVCLQGMENLVELLETVLLPYYMATLEVNLKTEIEDVLNVVYK